MIPEPEGFVATHDVLPGSLEVPTGRLVIDPYFYGDELTTEVPPGRHRVRTSTGRADADSHVRRP